ARELLTGGKPLLVTAEARPDEEGVRLMAQAIQPLDEAATNTAEGMRILLADPRSLAELGKVFTARGKGRISVVVPTEANEVEILLKGGYAVSPQLRALVQAMPGVAEVQEL